MKKYIFLVFVLVGTYAATKSKNNFTCEKIIYNDDLSQSKTAVLLNKQNEIVTASADPNEEITLNISGTIYTLTKKSFSTNEAGKKILNSMERSSCDKHLNCNGYKIKYKENGESKLTNLKTTGYGAGTQVFFGDRLLFDFASIENGFRFRQIKYRLENNKFAGVEIQCQQ